MLFATKAPSKGHASPRPVGERERRNSVIISACADPVADNERNLGGARGGRRLFFFFLKINPGSMDSGHSAAYLAYFCLLLRRGKEKKKNEGA